eukprot:scaffold1638_cov258-Pinguiococcus_pyrenoidosus.AAC.63
MLVTSIVPSKPIGCAHRSSAAAASHPIGYEAEQWTGNYRLFRNRMTPWCTFTGFVVNEARKTTAETRNRER